MIVGYDFFSGDDSYAFDTRASVGQVEEIRLTNGKFDEVNVRTNTSAPFSTSKRDWSYDNILLAKFENDLEAGSVGDGLELTSIVVKKRVFGDFVWSPVCTIDFNNEVSIYTAYDKIVRASEKYEWAIVPMSGTTEGTYIIVNPIEVDFEGGFLCDATHNYRLFYNLKIGDVALVRPNATIQPLSGSKYPFHVYNDDLSYHTGSVEALLSPVFDDDTVYMSSERALREEITKWLLNGEPKLYKLMDGTFFLINITGDVSLSPWENVDGKYLVSFNFEEWGDPTNLEDLKDAGLVVD